MRAPVEVYFTGGQNKRVGQELLLGAGETRSLSNADLLSRDGVLSPGSSFQALQTFTDNVHSIIGYPGGDVWIGEGGNLTKLGGTTPVFTGLTEATIRGVDYNGWMYIANGTERKRFLISNGKKSYDWGVASPLIAPTVSAGAAGNPNGTYPCYYSYVGQYADGSQYETNLSPVGTVTVSNQKINWTVPASSDPQILLKLLYRSVTGLTRYVAQLANSVTTYVDDTNDANLLQYASFERDGYYTPPPNIWDAVEYYRRIFVLVDGAYSHWMFWSEPEEPQAFLLDALTGLYSSSTDVFRKGDSCMGLVPYGGDLFIASRSTFKRLVGSDPTYWALRPTLATKGNVARYAMQVTPFGVLHVWFDGVYLFNGYNSVRVSVKNDPFFEQVNWSMASSIKSVYDGSMYRLFVPYGPTSAFRTFAIDFSRYPKIKCFEEDTGETLGWFNTYSNQCLLANGTSVGVKSGSGNVAFEAWSKTFPTDRLIQSSGAVELNYELDTGGQDVTLTLYHDNVAHTQTIILNTATRQRKVQSLPMKNARTISIKLSGNVSNAVKIYEPWIIGSELGRA